VAGAVRRELASPSAASFPSYGWSAALIRVPPSSIIRAAPGVRAVTGWDVTLEELLRVGERRLSLFRAFNAREGFGPADDRLPEKLYVPLRGGASDGVALDRAEMDQAVRWYYDEAGWDAATGAPTPEKLRSLGLEALTS